MLAFTVLVFVRNPFLTGGQRSRDKQLLASSPTGLVAGISDSPPSYPGSIPSHRIRVSLQGTTHCCLVEIFNAYVGWGDSTCAKSSFISPSLQ